ncbi:MAG: NIPSNAP family protein [Chloroflexi bacterium]|nr:NIPSNAP family protein [Chloroflexota bacterium]
MDINVIELRNYLLKPGVREHFIDYFEEHFIDTQETVGMQVLGQFRVLGEPDHFVWLRGFRDMQSRLEGLQNFYGGPVWEKYGPLANGMMLEWHNVRLLCPLSPIADLTHGFTADAIAADLAAGSISYDTGIIAIDFYETGPGQRENLIDRFQTSIMPAYQAASIQLRGYFVAELAENEFTRLPVIQNENELVVITAHESEAACREKHDMVARQINDITSGLLGKAPESLLLSPTLRSPLRYAK